MKIDPAIETVDTCVICHDSPTVADAHFAEQLGLIPPYGVQSCVRCGLRWLSPRPAPAGYRDLYTAENYFSGNNAVEIYATIAPARAAYFRRRLTTIARYFSRPRLSILDVGAATGEFVHEARRLGHDATGLELSDNASQTAKEKYGFDLLKHDLTSVVGSNKYDVIHMNHVFEHLPDPVTGLRACQRLLATSGLLVLEVPQQFDNDLDRLKHWLRRAQPPNFNAYSLHHTYFYTPRTLAHLLERNGFAVKYLATANRHRTPLRPFNPLNLLLLVYLWFSDKLHRGGNIIEVYAVKTDRESRHH